MTCPLIQYMEYKRWRQTYSEIAKLNAEASYEQFLKFMALPYYRDDIWTLTEQEEKDLEQRKAQARTTLLADQG